MPVILKDNYRESIADYRPTTLQERITKLARTPSTFTDEETEALLCEFIYALEQGDIRAASNQGNDWKANKWVKQGILSIFNQAENISREYNSTTYHDVMPTRNVTGFTTQGIRNTPGTTIRVGTYFGEGTTIMSESFVNIGAFIDDGTMIDSNVTVGSAAQIGKDGHIGANTTIGGVLDPIEQTPVVIGDNVSVGAGCRITQGFVIGDDVEIAEHTLLTPGIEVYDLVTEEVLKEKVPSERRVFQRQITSSLANHSFFQDNGQTPQKPIAVAVAKDEDAVELEDELRM
ncbi:MAG: 2,3,4,5-tetrahydropyridine-2,6-dicarboxylate N-succinyltransferase [Halobacteriaceae archaeon]